MLGGDGESDGDGVGSFLGKMLMDMPTRAVGMLSGGAFGQEQLDGLLAELNADESG
ncbi:MAG: hypothetical protein LBJ10_02865 [Clostridiales bacterium]|nr:hypothetical protein [Clostridiales bacterium]